jgi:hypothetical protein
MEQNSYGDSKESLSLDRNECGDVDMKKNYYSNIKEFDIVKSEEQYGSADVKGDVKSVSASFNKG